MERSTTATAPLDVDHCSVEDWPPRIETGLAVKEVIVGAEASAASLRDDVLCAPVAAASVVVSLPLSTRSVSTIITRGPPTESASHPRTRLWPVGSGVGGIGIERSRRFFATHGGGAVASAATPPT